MMDEYSMVMSQTEVSALKETLCAQQELLQKLYNDLDAEREASATATSEALSVILRLQGEKAAVKMEAEQYKRLSEAKMCHAEESLAMIEDVIYQKEMELAALDYQVQAYRYKLLSLGCVDPLQRNETLAGEASIHNLGRRNSVPQLLKYKKVVLEKENAMSMETALNDSDKMFDNSIPGDINSYWEQIRKLDMRVKEIAGGNNANFKNEMRSHSSLSPPSSQLSTGNGCEADKLMENEIDTIKLTTNMSRNGVAVDCFCPTSVHDVFEVPQVDKNLSSCESSSGDRRRTPCHGSEILKNDDYKEEPDWLKKVLQSNRGENELCKPSEIAGIDCRLAIVQTSTNVSESQPRSNQLHMRSEIVEIERPAESTNREEEITLLKDIKEKLDSLHDEIRSLKIKKQQHTLDQPSFHLFAEAMLHFWF